VCVKSFLLVQLLLEILTRILVACVANYWLIIPAIIIIMLQLLFRHYFLRASRDIQRLESIGNREL